MTRNPIIERMIEASKEDRGRFFAVADTMHLQPKYKDNLVELESEKQKWRDMTSIANYPEIKWPLDIPDWFPTIHFASSWDVDYVANTLESETIKEE